MNRALTRRLLPAREERRRTALAVAPSLGAVDRQAGCIERNESVARTESESPERQSNARTE